eukprot:GHVP01055454.1.p1 GENE.GHVP01055454.1~~GHVP01055454.1.p1  ORF type:complete len:301 (-),score=52.35 GHVP01055454.1:1013-1915(-)
MQCEETLWDVYERNKNWFVLRLKCKDVWESSCSENLDENEDTDVLRSHLKIEVNDETLSMYLNCGSFISIEGPSNTGKTTILANFLAQLLLPVDAGGHGLRVCLFDTRGEQWETLIFQNAKKLYLEDGKRKMEFDQALEEAAENFRLIPVENSVHLLAHLFQFSRYSHKSPIVLAIDTLEPPGTWTLKHSDVGVTSRRISNDIFTQRTEELAQRIAAVRKFVSCIIIKEVFLLYSIEEWHTTCEVTTGEENTPIGFDASFQFPVKIPNAEVSNVSSKRPIGIINVNIFCEYTLESNFVSN